MTEDVYTIHSLPEMDESGEYECKLEPGGLFAFYRLEIDRGWRDYPHANRNTPPESICFYEDINVELLSVNTEDGELVMLPSQIRKKVEKQIRQHVPSYID